MRHDLDVNSLLRKIAGAFPPPEFLSMPVAAIDISDTSVKYFDTEHTTAGFVPRNLDSLPLSPGIVSGGVVQDVEELAKVLRVFNKKYKRKFAMASLPEELVYLFTVRIPLQDGVEIKKMVEFALAEHVPISPKDAVFDYDIISQSKTEVEVSVTVYERSVVDGYINALSLAGFGVRALELEAHSIVRSVVPSGGKAVSMVCDFGSRRTGIAIARGQNPIFTITVNMGGDKITKAIMARASVTEEEASIIKRDAGLEYQDDKKVYEAILNEVRELVNEIERHYKFWDRRRDEHGDRVDRIENIYICGGTAALRGLAAYMEGELRVPVNPSNIWQNMFNVSEHVPQIDKKSSWRYATTAGLMLKSMR